MRSILLFFIIFIFTAFQSELKSLKVNVVGDLSSTTPGVLGKAVISLDTLKRTRLYALGSLENSEGQIIINNGIPIISVVNEGEVKTDKTLRKKASFLIYAKVGKWKLYSLPSKVRNYNSLELFIAEEARVIGLDPLKPIPFKLTGAPISVHWHVSSPGIEKQNSRSKPGVYDIVFEGEIEALGFYSESETIKLSLGESNMHMHFKNRNGKIAGHVDDIKMVGNMSLYLPNPNRL